MSLSGLPMKCLPETKGWGREPIALCGLPKTANLNKGKRF